MIVLLNAVSRVMAWLPLRLALAFGSGLGWALGSIFRFRRRDAREALRRSLPDLDPREHTRILQRMYRNLGMTVVEQLRISVLGFAGFERRIDVHGLEYCRESLSGPTGAIGLMAHIGNWELCGYFSQLVDRPVSVVVKPMRDPKFEAYLTKTRKQMNVHILPVRRSYRECLARLRKGEILAMILDQNTKADRGVFVEFFGRQACTTPGLAVLAAQTGAAVVPVFVVRKEHGRYDMIIQPPLGPPPNRDPDTLHEMTQRYTRIIEDIIRTYPDQWIWIHRRWRTQPK